MPQVYIHHLPRWRPSLESFAQRFEELAKYQMKVGCGKERAAGQEQVGLIAAPTTERPSFR
jgi:hypothetical protein